MERERESIITTQTHSQQLNQRGKRRWWWKKQNRGSCELQFESREWGSAGAGAGAEDDVVVTVTWSLGRCVLFFVCQSGLLSCPVFFWLCWPLWQTDRQAGRQTLPLWLLLLLLLRCLVMSLPMMPCLQPLQLMCCPGAQSVHSQHTHTQSGVEECLANERVSSRQEKKRKRRRRRSDWVASQQTSIRQQQQHRRHRRHYWCTTCACVHLRKRFLWSAQSLFPSLLSLLAAFVWLSGLWSAVAILSLSLSPAYCAEHTHCPGNILGKLCVCEWWCWCCTRSIRVLCCYYCCCVASL